MRIRFFFYVLSVLLTAMFSFYLYAIGSMVFDGFIAAFYDSSLNYSNLWWARLIRWLLPDPRPPLPPLTENARSLLEELRYRETLRNDPLLVPTVSPNSTIPAVSSNSTIPAVSPVSGDPNEPPSRGPVFMHHPLWMIVCGSLFVAGAVGLARVLIPGLS